MTDDQWRRALDKYAQPQPERFWPLRGGLHELARTLCSRAQQEPDRFTDFAFTLGPGSPAAYLCAIVEAVAPHPDADRWERLALHTHQTLGSEVAPTICLTPRAGGICGRVPRWRVDDDERIHHHTAHSRHRPLDRVSVDGE
ncbi:hypothetical protein [Streptomyces sp. NPDC001480]|uniref:hypothetical protein n=1 Tax=Streptomyces sp. NPDC001480 TaxID=3364577 RepID=UPI0036D0F075